VFHRDNIAAFCFYLWRALVILNSHAPIASRQFSEQISLPLTLKERCVIFLIRLIFNYIVPGWVFYLNPNIMGVSGFNFVAMLINLNDYLALCVVMLQIFTALCPIESREMSGGAQVAYFCLQINLFHELQFFKSFRFSCVAI